MKSLQNTLAAAALVAAGCFAGFALADQPAAVALAPLTIDEAVAESLHWSPRLSPSGRYLAMVRRKGKQGQIVVLDLQDAAAKPVVHAIPEGSVNWVRWDSDDRLLASTTFWGGRTYQTLPMAEVEGNDDAYRIARVVALDRDGKNYAMMFAKNDDALAYVDVTTVTDFLPEDPRHIVMSAWRRGYRDLYRVDTYSGEAVRIGKGLSGTLIWFTDREGYPAFRVDHNFTWTLLTIYARKGPGNVPDKELQWEEVRTIPLRDERNKSVPDFYPIFPGPDPNTYYVTARPDGADTSGIYLYDYSTRKYLKTLATEPGIDIESIFVDPRSRAFAGVELYGERRKLRMVDPRVQANFDALDDYFSKDVDIYLADHDRTMENWVLHTVGPRDRGSWHAYNLKSRSIRKIADVYTPLEAARLGATQVLRYKARDGLEIMGYLTRPPGAAPGSKPPLVLLPHGGPEVRDYFQYDAWVQMLATRGYQVFQPNFRGSAGFGKRFADAGKRQWGAAMQHDLTDAVQFLVDQGYVEPGRACIVGGSYGGYAALAGAAFTPDLYRCAVSIAGISDLPTQLRWDRKEMRRDAETWAYMKRQIGDPDDDEEMLESHSPARHADNVRIPVLLIHGDEDRLVPIEQSQKMEKALRKAGKDVQFVQLKDAGHHPDADDWKATFPPMLEFLDKHLPVVAPVPTAPAVAPPPPG